jgi:putative hydrolase of the HAD superfamily
LLHSNKNRKEELQITKKRERRKVNCKAVVFDYIGTLVEPRNYSLEASHVKLHKFLCEAGLKCRFEQFLGAYVKAHEKYRVIRYEKLQEVTNAVWVSEALNNVGIGVKMGDARLKAGLNCFFKDFVDSFQLRSFATELIKTVAQCCKVGLVSNFTYAPAIYSSLRKLRISQFLNAIVVSHDVGWRKPHKRIFEEILRMLQVKAEETVFVGDSPTEDIKGAKAVGMKTVFVTSQFFSLADLRKSGQKADLTFGSLKEICRNLPRVLEIA